MSRSSYRNDTLPMSTITLRELAPMKRNFFAPSPPTVLKDRVELALIASAGAAVVVLLVFCIIFVLDGF